MPLHLLLLRTFQVVSALVAAMGSEAAAPSQGCEVAAHVAPCQLDAVMARDDPASGEREVVAVYRTVGREATRYAERRFRVAYLGGTEDEHMNFLREHAAVTCRWQTASRAACPVASTEVEVPIGVDEGMEDPGPDDPDGAEAVTE